MIAMNGFWGRNLQPQLAVEQRHLLGNLAKDRRNLEALFGKLVSAYLWRPFLTVQASGERARLSIFADHRLRRTPCRRLPSFRAFR